MSRLLARFVESLLQEVMRLSLDLMFLFFEIIMIQWKDCQVVAVQDNNLVELDYRCRYFDK